MMDPEIKAKWIEALRSGSYKQGSTRLNKGDEFCCLGVLCEVLNQPYHRDEAGKIYEFDDGIPGFCAVPTKWHGIDNVHTYYNMNDGNNGWWHCAQTFEQIADHIEKNE